MRNNRTLKTEWMKKIRFADEYEVLIRMLCLEGVTWLDVTLFLDGEFDDNEILMCIDEEMDVPTPEMRRKFKQTEKYFKQYFENVKAFDEIVVV